MANRAGWALALLVMSLFASLGAWQLDRARQKQAMLEQAGRILAARVPVPLGAATRAGGAYEWAQGEGRFLALPAVLLDNQSHQGRPGVRVYRAFQPAGGAVPLLVDLGWLPLPGDRTLPRIESFASTPRVSGLLVPPPSSGLASPVISRQAGGELLATRLDPAMVASELDLLALAPRVLRLDPGVPAGYARDLDILPNTMPPERHVGYAVQWFGLAAAVLVTALVLTLRRRKRR